VLLQENLSKKEKEEEKKKKGPKSHCKKKASSPLFFLLFLLILQQVVLLILLYFPCLIYCPWSVLLENPANKVKLLADVRACKRVIERVRNWTSKPRNWIFLAVPRW
jgi:hypothetical protein